ncbi:MAG: hypothetical protein JO265_14220 [Acidimicrobiia bacterium]|nr:hypothetical protein [Acidimicrobiia bacterium]
MTAPVDTFEDRLLDVLLERFDDLTHPPRRHLGPVPARLRMRRYALPVGAVAAVAMAAAVVLELGGPGAPAPLSHPPAASLLAAWTAQPTAAHQSQVSTAEHGCSAVFDQSSSAQSDPAGKSGPPLPGGPWRPALVDTRGDLTLALYSNGSDWMACLGSPSFVSLSPLGTAGQTPAAEGSAVLDMMSNRGASGDPFTLAVGRSGSAVTGVGLQRTDGSVVTGTVGDGHFIAWWPGDDGVEALSVTTDTGARTDPVDPRFDRSGPPPSTKPIRLVNPSSRQP